MNRIFLLFKRIIMLFIMINFFFEVTYAQNVAITDEESYTAESSAMLDVKSLTKGFLVPRMNTAQRNAISSPTKGLLIFNIDNDKFYFFDGNQWEDLSAEGLWIITGSDIFTADINSKVGIGVSSTNSKFEIKGDASFGVGDTLFSVKDKYGNVVFAVFPDGARVYVDNTAKGNIGGFAVSGRSSMKADDPENYLYITADSTRVYFNSTAKGNIGGFAVSGRSPGKNINSSILNFYPDNYFIGDSCGLLTTGKYNNFFGYKAGANNTTGFNNVFMGLQSGYSNKNGWNNLFVGNKSGYSNIGGEENSFIGLNSGYENTSGRYNIFLGSYSGYSNTTGWENVYLGFNSGKKTTGAIAGNVFVGSWAGYENVSGSSNTYMGMHAGMNSASGSNNVYLGYSAGGYSGFYNTSIGGMSGIKNNGTGNIFIGHQSAANDTIGNYNTFIGYRTGYNFKGGSSNIFIGPNAGTNAKGSQQLFIENSSTDSTNALIWGDFSTNILSFKAKVGIGTTIPTEALEVFGNISVIGGDFIDDGTPIVPDYVFEKDYKLESIKEHSEFMWREKHLPAVKSASEINSGKGYKMAERREEILEELEKAHIYIDQLNNKIINLEKKYDSQINILIDEINTLKNK